MEAASRYVVIDGIRTHYLEAGDGPTLLLLHGGAPGDCAEASWERNIDALATRHRVIAPDWTGYGGTDKVRDLADPLGRMVRHLARFTEVLDLGRTAAAGLSMGGTLLVRDQASAQPLLAVDRMVLVSGGGFSPDNAARRGLRGYDGSLAAMRQVIAAVFHDPSFAADEEFVRRRHGWSVLPGAWEFAASLGLRAPAAPDPPPAPFGRADATPYERVAAPTLVTAGAHDPLREAGWADELAARLPQGRALVFDGSGHCPNLEESDAWNRAALDFLLGG